MEIPATSSLDEQKRTLLGRTTCGLQDTPKSSSSRDESPKSKDHTPKSKGDTPSKSSKARADTPKCRGKSPESRLRDSDDEPHLERPAQCRLPSAVSPEATPLRSRSRTPPKRKSKWELGPPEGYVPSTHSGSTPQESGVYTQMQPMMSAYSNMTCSIPGVATMQIPPMMMQNIQNVNVNNMQGLGAGGYRSRIYIGSLDYSVNEHEIIQLFSSFGRVTNVEMPREGTPPRSKGFCFLEYADPECAEKALTHMNEYPLNGRKMKVGRPTSQGNHAPFVQNRPIYSMGMSGNPTPAVGMGSGHGLVRNSRRLLVRNVPKVFTSAHLGELFSVFGKVLDGNLTEGVGNLQSAWVEMSTVEEALSACASMNGKEIIGHALQVELVHESAAYTQNTRVLLLTNLISPGQVDDDVAGEVKDECAEIAGPVEDVIINESLIEVRVFVVFKDAASVGKAQPMLHNRLFAGKRVNARPYPETAFLERKWNLPC